uniref:Uncharacterized protein n=1 Tax=Angiostrongylus cantonensis TaxID=6313 RepID=A0A158P5X0_ANGCA
MLMPEPCSYYNDVDEHSLGSCSAEVAAINLNGRRDKPKKSNGFATFNSFSVVHFEKYSLSLPDAGLIIRGRYQQQQQTTTKDPSLAIDQLCAELELNTEHVCSFVYSKLIGNAICGNANFLIDGVPQDFSKHVPGHVLYATPHSTNQSNPFETINQEKINPSRVEAMHNMFERNTGQTFLRASPPRQSVRVHHSPQSYTTTEFIPAYPTTQPPSHPPGRNGVYLILFSLIWRMLMPIASERSLIQSVTYLEPSTSSQNGGYYSSNSSGISAAACQNNQIAARRGSIGGHQSASSRAASVADDEDDGFYDNIGTFDDRRFSRSSEMDVTSLSSHQLPPSGWKPTKIGSFLRKFGGGSRPPGSAASLVSLNKVANETPINSGNLMKSNSLSNEPWKKMVIDGPSIPARECNKGGFRTRIKNSIFGSKRRLNG